MPLHWLLTAYCAVLFIGCGDSSDGSANRSLSIGANSGLSSFEVGPSPSGSSAAAGNLLFEGTQQYIISTEVDGQSTILHLRPDSSKTARELADSFRYNTLVSAQVLNHSAIKVIFSDKESAKTVATLCCGVFALGPFELKEQSETAATLKRKEEHPIDELVLRDISAQDEWRLFLGGELDIIPKTSSLYRKQFEQMPSVTIVDYPPVHQLGLFFNTKKDYISDSNVRHKLAHLIDRDALTTVLFDNVTASIQPWDMPPMDSGLPAFPKSMQLAYLSQDSNIARAAEVIRFQLADFGVSISLVPLDIADFMTFCVDGSFDLALLPVPIQKLRYGFFLSNEFPDSMNFTGYASDEYDAAYRANDTSALVDILRRDIPFTPLYTQSKFAAVNSDLCIGETPTATSWLWIASVSPCAGASHR